MFAYCGNNPVCCSDSSGTSKANALRNQFGQNSFEYGGGGSGGAVVVGGGALLLPGLIDVVDEAATGLVLAVSYVYRQFTRYIKATAYGMSPGSYPVTHHIIPYGDFSVRSKAVKDQLHEAQQIMKDAGIDPKTDLINQLPLSATYHASLHTDAYILMVTAPIIALGDEATPDDIYAVLYDLRIIIAAGDQYAWGY